MNLIALEARLAPIIAKLLESPAVQENVSVVSGLITGHILEIINEEAQKACSNQGFIQSAINKIKGVFGMAMDENTANVVGAVVTGVEMTLEQKKEELIAGFKAEINAQHAQQAAGQPYSAWVVIRDTMYISLVEGADDYIVGLLIAKMAKV